MLPIDNYPQFSETIYESAIYENALEGTSIAQIIATDKDIGDFGEIRFTSIKGIFADKYVCLSFITSMNACKSIF